MNNNKTDAEQRNCYQEQSYSRESRNFGANVYGSATVEMAYIMPLFFMVFLLIVSAVFFFHDKCVLYATAYETAVIGAQKERGKETNSERELAEHFHARIQGKLIFFAGAEVFVEQGLKTLTVRAEASRGSWKISTEQKAMLMGPEELIYLQEAGTAIMENE